MKRLSFCRHRASITMVEVRTSDLGVTLATWQRCLRCDRIEPSDGFPGALHETWRMISKQVIDEKRRGRDARNS